MDCLIVGDSIAGGLAEQMKNCAVNARASIPAAEIIGRARDADVLIVSAGSNDPHNPALVDELEALRAKTRGRVIWISPIDPMAAQAVASVARRHGDTIVQFMPAADGVHPRSYDKLSDDVRSAIAKRR